MLKCPECGKKVSYVKAYRTVSLSRGQTGYLCSEECSDKWRAAVQKERAAARMGHTWGY